MPDWIALLRGRIKANLDRNPRLSEGQRAAALEAELGRAIAATESGQPLNETNPPREVVPDESGTDIGPLKRAREKAVNWDW